jgi:CspA family cold shock protein
MKGTVKWFNRIRGYGFVKGDDGNEYFVHRSALPEGEMLDDDDEVEFKAADTDKGKQAQEVKITKKAGNKSGEESEEPEQTEEKQEEDSE